MTYESVSLTFRILASLFFGGLTLVAAGLTAWGIYETTAIWTRIVPTISLVTSFEYLRHPHWFVTLVFIVGVALGSLITHFTHWTP